MPAVERPRSLTRKRPPKTAIENASGSFQSFGVRMRRTLGPAHDGEAALGLAPPAMSQGESGAPVCWRALRGWVRLG